jgi:endonuclease/exonuclease/phosphatase family metal-dependent hydrolase
VPLVVRTWNLYHGRTSPPGGRTYLERMIDVITADRPDVVALQEVPVWALGRLERQSGMAARWAVTVPALLVAPLAKLVTAISPTRLRSLVTGQANVLLVAKDIQLHRQHVLVLNPSVGRWDWLRRGAQRRVCQAVEIEVADGRRITFANLHATNNPLQAPEEVARAAEFVADAPLCVLCGDFNARDVSVEGFSPPIPGIDQILVRGLELERPPEAWPKERRREGSRLLSDHAPVEAVIA